MLKLTEHVPGGSGPVGGTLELPFEVRQKSRFRSLLTDGTEVGVVIERGHILRDGDLLQDAGGTRVRVQAAAEPVSTVRSQDARALARACYHLGNRHVPLQVEEGFARYLQDHVLDDMVRGLGLEVTHEDAPFEPEAGAYGGGHGHGHQH